MKSSNKVLILIMTLLIMLLITGGAFAYVYFATDILKTDKQLFFEYFSQVTTDEENSFFDNRINDFYEKKKQTPYENTGEITFEVEYPDDSMKSVIEKVNDLSIRYSGEVDSVNQKAEQNIEVDYGNDVVLPINYRQDGNKFGLKTDKLSKKFIAIRNENIDELIDNVSGDGITSMSSRINGISEILTTNSYLFSGFKFSEEEKNQLKQIYNPILQEALVEEKFTRTKTEQNESYILEISFQEIKDIIIKMLEKTKENTLLIDKLNETVQQIDPEMEKMDVSDIDDIVKSLKEDDVSQLSNLKIALVQSNKKVNQIVIENEECKILISKNKTADVLKYSVELQKTEKGKQEESDSSIIMDNIQSSQQVNIHFNMQYSGLETLTNVQENYEIGFVVIEDEEKMGYNYNIASETEFVNTVEIDAIDETTAVILNDYEESQITSFLGQVGTKLLDINKKQMEELGLKEHENPVLYTNPVTMIVISFVNMANDTIVDTDFSEAEKSAFNARFAMYEGQAVSGSVVNAMITTVKSNNLSSQSQVARLVKVTLNGIENWNDVEIAKLYTVEAIYNEEGFISEMKVTTNN